MLYPKLFSSFSNLNKKNLLSATYESLAETIRKQYNFQQFKIPSTLSLLEAHHQFHIFKPGDWVLDIGAGPHWSWTDLAIKLTNNQQMTNLVISNDIIEMMGTRQQNRFVRGRFEQEQIRTKIAMGLVERQLNTILIDATDEYKGEINVDGMYTLKVVFESLKFSQRYLKKGGNMVFRTLETNRTLHFQQKAKYIFNEVYKYKPSNLRHQSPVAFFILKGFQMTPNEEGLKKFLAEYKGKKAKKVAVVEKYRKLYTWDPVQIIENEAKQRILQMKSNGFKNKEIIKVFENEPFVDIQKLITYFKILEDPKANPIEKVKAKEILITGRDPFSGQDFIPTTEEQFAELLLKPEAEKVNNSPLGQNEVYLKEEVKEDGKAVEEYRKEDLYGYGVGEEKELEEMQDEVEKMKKSFDELREKEKKEKKDGQMGIDELLNDGNKYEKYLKEKEEWNNLEEEERMRLTAELEREFQDYHERYQQKIEHMRNQQPKSDRYVNRRVSRRKKSPF